MLNLTTKKGSTTPRWVNAYKLKASSWPAKRRSVKLREAMALESKGDDRHVRRIATARLTVAAEGKEEVLEGVARICFQHGSLAHSREAKPVQELCGLPVGGGL